ncbi:MAG: phosphatase [Clostridia bacterium]|nr:phosphatase [Clostridia bacterium]
MSDKNFSLEADLHTHTVASGHAYSTIKEMAEAAANKGLKLIAITDHSFSMPGSPPYHYFDNLPRIVPRYLQKVEILKGIEVNIIDSYGNLDVPDRLLEILDWVGVAFHEQTDYRNHSMEENTRAIVTAISHPLVDFVAHPVSDAYPVDLEKIVYAVKRESKFLEVNNNSLVMASKKGRENYKTMLCLVKKYGASIVINSDAHIFTAVGECEEALALVNSLGINESQVLNCSADRVRAYVGKRNKALKV